MKRWLVCCCTYTWQ